MRLEAKNIALTGLLAAGLGLSSVREAQTQEFDTNVPGKIEVPGLIIDPGTDLECIQNREEKRKYRCTSSNETIIFETPNLKNAEREVNQFSITSPDVYYILLEDFTNNGTVLRDVIQTDAGQNGRSAVFKYNGLPERITYFNSQIQITERRWFADDVAELVEDNLISENLNTS